MTKEEIDKFLSDKGWFMGIAYKPKITIIVDIEQAEAADEQLKEFFGEDFETVDVRKMKTIATLKKKLDEKNTL